MTRPILIPSTLFALMLVVGCGGDVASVSGKVTLDGNPLEGATVSFTPSGGEIGQATGKTDAQGRYTLKTVVKNRSGAAVGKNKVTITLYKPNPSNPDSAGMETVPKKYNDKSELSFDVPSGGSDSADFDLKSK